MKEDKVYLSHILEAIEQIEGYLVNTDGEDSLKQDRKTLDAVVGNLAIIGEAANNLSEEFRQQHSDLPYKDIVGMRNVVVHDYFGVNVKVIWDTCKEDLPRLKGLLSEL